MKMLLIVAVVIVLLLVSKAEAARPAAALRITPRIMLERGDAHCVVTLKDDAPARGSWSLVWDSEKAGAGSTSRQFNEDSQRTTDVWIVGLPAANWVFELQIFDQQGKLVFHVLETIAGPEDR